jgi:hypothetical protein
LPITPIVGFQEVPIHTSESTRKGSAVGLRLHKPSSREDSLNHAGVSDRDELPNEVAWLSRFPPWISSTKLGWPRARDRTSRSWGHFSGPISFLHGPGRDVVSPAIELCGMLPVCSGCSSYVEYNIILLVLYIMLRSRNIWLLISDFYCVTDFAI